MSNTQDPDQHLLTDHQYDGIKEYDNPLPNWWLVTFFGTIIFGFLYWVHFSIGGGATQLDELNLEMSALPQKQERLWVEADFANQLDDNQFQLSGAVIYNGRCASCHAPDGGGIIGPNLTDQAWIHGQGKASEVANLLVKGVVEKGMPAWGTILSEEEIKQVSIFVHSLKGKTPKNPKAAEGIQVSL
ncbi:MAG: cbb3-type cytochrome c oxidase N-terminal domain-containing protein [Bdellovibrionales bacterium]